MAADANLILHHFLVVVGTSIVKPTVTQRVINALSITRKTTGKSS
jgi:hypothetical protein